MGAYYLHEREERAELPYSFQCEQCGKDSGFLSAVIIGPSVAPGLFKTISPARDQKLCKKAHKRLVGRVKRVHKDAVEKKIFPKIFDDQCPHCNEPQSWAVPIMIKDRFDDSFTALGVGAFISGYVVLGHYLKFHEILTLPLAAAIFALSVPIAIGLFVRRMAEINVKIKRTAPGAKNTPVIYWNAVQELLDEE